MAISQLPKCSTGIQGFDEILNGGLPRGRPTLVCGGAGSGKTLFSVEFLARGISEYGEPGVMIAFEETAHELAENVASLGIDLDRLVNSGKLVIDYIHIEPSEIEETGEYDLEGLFLRLGNAIDSVGAKRVVLDTLEALFTGFKNENILRAELRRLFRWLKAREVTAIITAERGNGTLTRNGMEEYVSDCVILLDHRVERGNATRLMRVVKYRGSNHGNNEFPFLIDQNGIWVLPVTSAGLDYPTTQERISSGIPRLDAMLIGGGYYRGSSILVSGSAGTGKTSLASTLIDSACRSGERCLYFAFEESPEQIIRNMRSINIDLAQWVKQDLLQFHAIRPTLYGLEMHLLSFQKAVIEFQPSLVIIDPVNGMENVGSDKEGKIMLVRLVDFFKMKGITTLFTSLTGDTNHLEASSIGVSSLMDTWLLLRNLENNGERNRSLFILKSRGMSHSNQVREMVLSDRGIDLLDVYVGPHGVLTGSARLAQQAAEQAEAEQRKIEIQRLRRDLERKQAAFQAQEAELQARYSSVIDELERNIEEVQRLEVQNEESQAKLARARFADIQAKEASL
jgi:circadian clock protein KaiC